MLPFFKKNKTKHDSTSLLSSYDSSIKITFKINTSMSSFPLSAGPIHAQHANPLSAHLSMLHRGQETRGGGGAGWHFTPGQSFVTIVTECTNTNYWIITADVCVLPCLNQDSAGSCHNRSWCLGQVGVEEVARVSFCDSCVPSGVYLGKRSVNAWMTDMGEGGKIENN